MLAIAGFSDPSKDPLEDDLKLWMPDESHPPTDLDLEQSRYLLTQVGDQFCDLLVQERNAIEEHISDGKCTHLGVFLLLVEIDDCRMLIFFFCMAQTKLWLGNELCKVFVKCVTSVKRHFLTIIGRAENVALSFVSTAIRYD